jgi:hypothetical protein
MISIGYGLIAKQWFDDSTGKLFARVVSCIALPAYMLWNLLGNFDKERLLSIGNGLIVPVISMAFCYIIGYVVSMILKVEPGRKGTFQSMFFVSNSVFIGLPINLALFGQDSLPYVLLYYIANTTLFWTVGVHGISTDGSAAGKKLFSRDTLRQIFSPPLMGFVAAVILILLGVKLPDFIMETCKYLGGMTTPLSMLFIGIALHDVKFREIKWSKDMLAIIIGRFIVSPLTIWLIATIIPIPLLMKKVFIIQAAMPVMTQTSIVAKYYETDYRYAAVMTATTTVLVMLVIPLYMTFL